ncbi:MAG: stage II sporulation protein M [Firmicutes bacterium]|nr:stage II sporulation protein M [Bacillota bacterium]
MFFLLKLRFIIEEYFRDRIFILILVLVLFLMGTIFGILATGMLSPVQRDNLLGYLDQGLHGEIFTPNSVYTRQTIVANIKIVFFLFFMGISVIGVPLALLLIFTRGFILGYSVSFLLRTMGFKGLVLILTGVLPHNLLIIPALIVMVIAIIDFAAALTKIRFTKKQVVIGEEMIKCAILTVVVLVVMMLAGFVQGFITPLFTAWLTQVI